MQPVRMGRRERGITLFGLLFWGVLLAFVAVVGMKVFPTLLEYQSVQKLVNRVADANPPTVAAARADFEHRKEVEYGVDLAGSDLVITKENDKVKISFAYQREIHLGGPAYLVMKYEGSSR